MHALVNDTSHPLAVNLRTDLSEPDPAPGEVVVAVEASTVNRGELALLAARPAGWRPGQDVAGVVVR
ncbi:MAG: NAD(P)-dependent alcohol dehydrogenase, partial [Nocardioides sp.]|nr:NAD(P)-dependent alcohol dehydrogenase [Nocardioides sp.]